MALVLGTARRTTVSSFVFAAGALVRAVAVFVVCGFVAPVFAALLLVGVVLAGAFSVTVFTRVVLLVVEAGLLVVETGLATSVFFVFLVAVRFFCDAASVEVAVDFFEVDPTARVDLTARLDGAVFAIGFLGFAADFCALPEATPRPARVLEGTDLAAVFCDTDLGFRAPDGDADFFAAEVAIV